MKCVMFDNYSQRGSLIISVEPNYMEYNAVCDFYYINHDLHIRKEVLSLIIRIWTVCEEKNNIQQPFVTCLIDQIYSCVFV